MINKKIILNKGNCSKKKMKLILKYGFDLAIIEERINNKFIIGTHYIINRNILGFKIIVNLIPYGSDWIFEAYLIKNNRYVRFLNKSLVWILSTFLGDYIDTKDYKLFRENSYPLEVKFSNKLFKTERNYLVCLNNKKKELFRKKITKYEILGIEESPIGNGILVLSEIKKINGVYDDRDDERTNSLGLFDHEGNNIWYAERGRSKYDKQEFYEVIKVKDGELIALSWSDIVKLDLRTGNVIETGPNK